MYLPREMWHLGQIVFGVELETLDEAQHGLPGVLQQSASPLSQQDDCVVFYSRW